MNTSNSPFSPDHPTPYYAAIFSSPTPLDQDQAERFGARIFGRAARDPSFIGAEVANGTDGFAIATIYWKDRAALDNWLAYAGRLLGARAERGPEFGFGIYGQFKLRVATIEADVGFGV